VGGTRAGRVADDHQGGVMNLSTRERRLGLTVGILAAGAVLYLVVIRWAVPAWTDTRKKIAKKQEELRRIEAVVLTTDRRRAEYQARLGLVMREPSTEDAERIFLNKLNALASAAEMSTPAIRTLSPKREDHYDVIRLSFEIKCTFQQFLTFLDKFYKHKGAHRIDTITVKPKGRYLSAQDLLSVNTTISAVVIPQGGKKPPPKKRGGKRT